MNSCIDFSENISAYADGELAQQDRLRLEEHLGACESCSGLLELYLGISSAMDESAAPVPEALCSGVMEKILSEGTAATDATLPAANAAPPAGKPTTRKPVRLILLRYVPMAACLALVLLTLPFIIGNFIRAPRDSSGSLEPQYTTNGAVQKAVTEMDDDGMQADAAMPEEAVRNKMNDSSAPMSGGSSDAADAAPEKESAPDPSASSPAQSQSASGAYQSQADDSTALYPFMTMDAPMIAEGSGPEPEPESVLITVFDPPEATESDEEAKVRSQGEIDNEEAPLMPGAGSDAHYLLDNFSDAYAWITITGGLPNTLTAYPSVVVDDWIDWDVYYMIPRAKTQGLIDEIITLNGVTIEYNNIDGTYSIVLYSPG